MLNKIGDKYWNFVDASGEETFLPPVEVTGSLIHFPTQWRVFGPLEAGLVNIRFRSVKMSYFPPIQEFQTIPNELIIGNRKLKGQSAVLVDGELDLGKLFGEHKQGQQAYAFAEFDLTEDGEVIFGAGAVWWMQWWIDGEPVYNTLAQSNRFYPPSCIDHSFRCRLSSGKHLIVVLIISGEAGWILKAGMLTAREQVLSKINSSEKWQFLPDLNEIRPAKKRGFYWIHTMAINVDQCLTEEIIECDFQLGLEGIFGIIIGAQDSGHYYLAQVPRWGQLWRARGFWASICKADGSGYLRNLKMELMPNVVCHWNAWLHLKVQRCGNHIQMWVNGVRGPCVTDDTYGAGRVGLAGFANYMVRNLKINGKVVSGPPWAEGDLRGQPWFNIDPDPNIGDVQAWIPGTLLKFSDEEIIMAITIGRDTSCHCLDASNSTTYLYSSSDSGRTWLRYGLAREGIPGTWFVPEPGRIRALQADPTQFSITYRNSTDKGQTWANPVTCRLLGDWKRDILRDRTWNALCNITRLNDGTLLGVILHGYKDLSTLIPNRGQGTWGTEVCQPYCTLSRDQGLSWSEPVPMDNAALYEDGKPDSPCGGFSETSVAQLPTGEIVALARPFHSPFMWQTHSKDGGKSWRMACYAPFSGAGGPVLVATQSGYLVSIKRGPATCLHFSTDGGVNWDQGTIIDFPTSFNGSAIEVEPNVVLVVYPESMDEIRPSYTRAQLIQITPEGPVPIKR